MCVYLCLSEKTMNINLSNYNYINQDETMQQIEYVEKNLTLPLTLCNSYKSPL